jgi:hypothetical protein
MKFMKGKFKGCYLYLQNTKGGGQEGRRLRDDVQVSKAIANEE